MDIPVVVVDSSVVVKWLNQTDEKYLNQADKLFKRVSTTIEITAPEQAKFEIGNALLYKHLSLPEYLEAIDLLYSFPLTFFPWNISLAKRTAELAVINKITYYDASFMCLAEYLHATLVTDNPKHQKNDKGIRIIALKDYR